MELLPNRVPQSVTIPFLPSEERERERERERDTDRERGRESGRVGERACVCLCLCARACMCSSAHVCVCVHVCLCVCMFFKFIYFIFILSFYNEDNGISTYVFCCIKSPSVCGFVNSVICSHRHTMAYSYEKRNRI